MPAITTATARRSRRVSVRGWTLFALSFVRDCGYANGARNMIQGHGGDIPIVAKIERRQAVANLDAILAEADGAMVARGDWRWSGCWRTCRCSSGASSPRRRAR